MMAQSGIKVIMSKRPVVVDHQNYYERTISAIKPCTRKSNFHFNPSLPLNVAGAPTDKEQTSCVQ